MRNKSYRKRITDQDRAKIVEYYLIGMPRKRISKELRIRYSTVCESIREYEELKNKLRFFIFKNLEIESKEAKKRMISTLKQYQDDEKSANNSELLAEEEKNKGQALHIAAKKVRVSPSTLYTV